MEHHFLEMRSLIKTSLRFIMKFPGEERSLIKTYLRSLIKTDFMEQPSDVAMQICVFLYEFGLGVGLTCMINFNAIDSCQSCEMFRPKLPFWDASWTKLWEIKHHWITGNLRSIEVACMQGVHVIISPSCNHALPSWSVNATGGGYIVRWGYISRWGAK